MKPTQCARHGDLRCTEEAGWQDETRRNCHARLVQRVVLALIQNESAERTFLRPISGECLFEWLTRCCSTGFNLTPVMWPVSFHAYLMDEDK